MRFDPQQGSHEARSQDISSLLCVDLAAILVATLKY